MRIEIMALALTLTGCLFAPPRPSNDGDGDGDGGVPDGGVFDGDGDADPSTCTPTPEAVLDVVAAVPKPDSDFDILVRAGTDHGTAHVYLYDAGADPLRTCADAVFDLTQPEFGVTRVLAVAPGPPNRLIVLAETSQSSLRVFEIDLVSFAVSPASIEVNGLVGPLAGVRSPFVAHASSIGGDQIWLGGPDLTTIDITAGFGSPEPQVSPEFVLPNFQDKILFAASTDEPESPIQLVGQVKAYGAKLETKGSVVLTPTEARDKADCPANPADCEVQLVRPIFGGPARVAGHVHVVLRPASGKVAIAGVAGDSYTLLDTPMPAFDVALDDFNGGVLDVITLQGAPRYISVFTDHGSSGSPVRNNHPVPDTIERIVVGKFTSVSARQILGLATSPTGVGAGESCLAAVPGAFMPCADL